MEAKRQDDSRLPRRQNAAVSGNAGIGNPLSYSDEGVRGRDGGLDHAGVEDGSNGVRRGHQDPRSVALCVQGLPIGPQQGRTRDASTAPAYASHERGASAGFAEQQGGNIDPRGPMALAAGNGPLHGQNDDVMAKASAGTYWPPILPVPSIAPRTPGVASGAGHAGLARTNGNHSNDANRQAIDEKRAIIVSGLDPGITGAAGADFFRSMGEIEICRIPLLKPTQAAPGANKQRQSQGRAYVTYKRADDALQAFKKLNGMIMSANGNKLQVSYQLPKDSAALNGNLFVANIPEGWTIKDVDALVRPFGTLLAIRIIVDGKTGHPRGFAFVTFVDDADAHQAAKALHGCIIPGVDKKLTVRVAGTAKRNRRGNHVMAQQPVETGIQAAPRISPVLQKNQLPGDMILHISGLSEELAKN